MYHSKTCKYLFSLIYTERVLKTLLRSVEEKDSSSLALQQIHVVTAIFISIGLYFYSKQLQTYSFAGYAPTLLIANKLRYFSTLFW